MVRAVVRYLEERTDVDAQTDRVREHFLQLEQNYLRSLESLRSAEKALVRNDGNRTLMRSILAVQRKELAAARKERVFDDELLRKMEGNLDLEEARLNN